MEKNKELNLELNLDDLESVNGGSGLSDAILNSAEFEAVCDKYDL